MKSKRVEILFDPKEYRTLEERAQAEGRSVGSMIREAVEKYVVRPREDERREALRWLTSQQMDFDPDWDKVKKDIVKARISAIEKSLETD